MKQARHGPSDCEVRCSDAGHTGDVESRATCSSQPLPCFLQLRYLGHRRRSLMPLFPVKATPVYLFARDFDGVKVQISYVERYHMFVETRTCYAFSGSRTSRLAKFLRRWMMFIERICLVSGQSKGVDVERPTRVRSSIGTKN
jgi:hypothetical protein